MSPTIKRIKGLRIEMYSGDHHSTPHVHLRFAEYAESVTIRSLETLAGGVPAKQRQLAVQWIADHRDELLNMYAERLQDGAINYIKD